MALRSAASASRWLTLAFVLAGLAWSAALITPDKVGLGPWLARLEYLTVDWRFALLGPRKAPDSVVILAIDEQAIAAAGGYPLPRDRLARIVRAVAAQRPAAIAIDIAFLDAGAEAATADLAAALRAAPAVVGAIAQFPPGGDAPSTIAWPTAAVREAARVGVVNLVTDESGVPRYAPMLFSTEGGVTPSFALAAVALARDAQPRFADGAVVLNGRSVALDRGDVLPIGYFGPQGTFSRASVEEALQAAPGASGLSGKIVLIGATAVGVGDTFATPFDRATPGVEIMATVVANLMGEGVLTRDARTRAADTAATFALPAIVVLLLAFGRAWAGVLLALAIVAAWIAASVVGFAEGAWLSLATPLAALVPPSAVFAAARLALDRANARRLTSENLALARFQSPRLTAMFRAEPSFLQAPLQAEVAVMFVDLSGFTGLAQRRGAEAARGLLNAFQTIVEREVAAADGFVVSFMGDGAMALFGLPESAGAARFALEAVERLHRALAAWIAGLGPDAGLGARIGAHFGPAIVSRLGPSHHQNVTATGDVVNVASRLLEVAKTLSASAVISQALADAAGGGAAAAWQPSVVEMRGRTGTLNVRFLRAQTPRPPEPS